MVQTDVIGLISVALAPYERMKVHRQKKIVRILSSTTSLSQSSPLYAHSTSSAPPQVFSHPPTWSPTHLAFPTHSAPFFAPPPTAAPAPAISKYSPPQCQGDIEVTTVLPGYIEFSNIANGSRMKSLHYKSAASKVRKVVLTEMSGPLCPQSAVNIIYRSFNRRLSGDARRACCIRSVEERDKRERS